LNKDLQIWKGLDGSTKIAVRCCEGVECGLQGFPRSVVLLRPTVNTERDVMKPTENVFNEIKLKYTVGGYAYRNFRIQIRTKGVDVQKRFSSYDGHRPQRPEDFGGASNERDEFGWSGASDTVAAWLLQQMPHVAVGAPQVAFK
jgi:hypothetical protein